MSLAIEGQVGKKHTIYIPKAVVEKVGLTEGMRILITVEDNRIIIEPLPDPVTLALHGKKFATVGLEELEAISREEQSRITEDSS